MLRRPRGRVADTSQAGVIPYVWNTPTQEPGQRSVPKYRCYAIGQVIEHVTHWNIAAGESVACMNPGKEPHTSCTWCRRGDKLRKNYYFKALLETTDRNGEPTLTPVVYSVPEKSFEKFPDNAKFVGLILDISRTNDRKLLAKTVGEIDVPAWVQDLFDLEQALDYSWFHRTDPTVFVPEIPRAKLDEAIVLVRSAHVRGGAPAKPIAAEAKKPAPKAEPRLEDLAGLTLEELFSRGEHLQNNTPEMAAMNAALDRIEPGLTYFALTFRYMSPAHLTKLASGNYGVANQRAALAEIRQRETRERVDVVMDIDPTIAGGVLTISTKPAAADDTRELLQAIDDDVDQLERTTNRVFHRLRIADGDDTPTPAMTGIREDLAAAAAGETPPPAKNAGPMRGMVRDMIERNATRKAGAA